MRALRLRWIGDECPRIDTLLHVAADAMRKGGTVRYCAVSTAVNERIRSPEPKIVLQLVCVTSTTLEGVYFFFCNFYGIGVCVEGNVDDVHGLYWFHRLVEEMRT